MEARDAGRCAVPKATPTAPTLPQQRPHMSVAPRLRNPALNLNTQHKRVQATVFCFKPNVSVDIGSAVNCTGSLPAPGGSQVSVRVPTGSRWCMWILYFEESVMKITTYKDVGRAIMRYSAFLGVPHSSWKDKRIKELSRQRERAVWRGPPGRSHAF